MKNTLSFLYLFAAFAISFGGPLAIFSYSTQSIVFACSVMIYLVIQYPHKRLFGAGDRPADQDDHTSMLGSLIKEVMGDDEDFDLPAVTRSKPVVKPKPTTTQTKTRPVGSYNGPYQTEALEINKLLVKTFELNAVINIDGIAKSWNYVTYPLTQTGPLRFADVQKIEIDLGREISARHRSPNGKNQRVEVLAVDAHPKILLQVTRGNPQPLLWNERPKTVKSMNTVIGFYADGMTQKPLTIDMFGNDSEHVNGAFFGQPGAGKSSVLLTALDILLTNTPPSMLDVYGIDMKKNTFKRYTDVPHMRNFTSNAEHALGILDQFAMWCHEETAPDDLKYRLLVIDEFQMLINHSEYGKASLEKVTKIMQAGREWGIRVWTATQNPNADNYPAALKPLTHFKACGHIENDDYVRRQLQIYGASKVTPKREMIFVDAFGDHRITTFWYSNEDREKGINELEQTWKNGDPVARHENIVLDASKVRFPVPYRTLSPVEKEAARLLYAQGLSLNKLCDRIYGSKNANSLGWVKEAIHEQS